jgi:hypothetical protein
MPEKKKKDVTLSPNFMLSEFQADKDTHKVKASEIDKDLLNHLELMRFIGGGDDNPLVINDGGGYRSKKYNEDAGGVDNSSHTRGRGADLKVEGGQDRARLAACHVLACAVEAHAMSKEKARVIFTMMMEQTFGGLGIADGFVHVDVEKPGGNLPRKGTRPGTWGY